MNFFNSVINQIGRDVGRKISNKLLNRKPEIPTNDKKDNGNVFTKTITKFLFFVLIIFSFYYVFYIKKNENFDKIEIGKNIIYKEGKGDINLYQLGSKKLDYDEQKSIGFKSETSQEFIITNKISEKYFVDNNTQIIGKMIDTILFNNKDKWIKIALDSKILHKAINFDELKEKFNVTLKIKNSQSDIKNLSKDFYVNFEEISDLIEEKDTTNKK
jgi:hypothetical protein